MKLFDRRYDIQEHVHEETSLAENAQEVEYLDPHPETGARLHREAELVNAWSFIILIAEEFD